MSTLTSSCWCGSRRLAPFSAHYLRCLDCETLCAAVMPDPGALLVQDDDRDLYGSRYFDRVAEEYGFPSLEERARLEIPERCAWWLRALLRRKLPPGRTLELGCSHGGFVALMRAAGFDASGLELSPGLAQQARRRFDIPVLSGPFEKQAIAPGSLDAVILMDVVEHLQDPLETLRCCQAALKPGGIILIQTPRYREGKSLQSMTSEQDPFLVQLKEEQHLYLFSRNSVQVLLRRAGAGFVEFDEAIFGHYDMSLAAGRAPLADHSEQEIAAALSSTASRRLALALLDSQNQRIALAARLNELERRNASSRPRELARLQKSLVYRTMRRLGLWGWLAAGIERK